MDDLKGFVQLIVDLGHTVCFGHSHCHGSFACLHVLGEVARGIKLRRGVNPVLWFGLTIPSKARPAPPY